MKKINTYIAASVLAVLGLSACNETIVVDKVDEGAYANVTSLVTSLRDASTNRVENVVEMRSEPIATEIVYTLGRAPKKGVDVTVQYDAAYVDAYNQAHGTSFRAYPESKVSLQNGGKIVVAPDEKVSYALDLTLDPFDDKEEATYVLPLKAVTTTDGVKVSEDESHLVYLVKNMSWQSSVIRKEGEKKIINWIEVNNTNPLNMLQFETEDGRLLTDYVVFFAYNINYNKETGEVYVFSNPQCQYILDHYDEVVRPLRERGIKVIISILGNHDESGLAQLSDAGCRDFAQKVAAIVNGYGFDGVNYDDEYSNSPDLSNPLFAQRSTTQGNRLYFETKKALPDKEMVSYQVGSARGNAPVDGVDPADYMDIFNGDYGRRAVPYGRASLATCSYQSTEFAQGWYFPTASEAQNFVNSDYGFWMTFSLWNSQGRKSDWDAMNILSQAVLGSPLKKPAYYYPETKSLETKPITW
ncbi:MAG: DUF1735 domain-containing protein [Bacteroidales bacterium]|nr:DUF1735 domain-containing protein [Bacteroidales bacterium]